MREEVSIRVPEDDVWNDLLKVGIVLDLGARLEEVALADHRLVTLEVVAHEAVPGAVGKDVLPLHAQHLFGRRRHTIRTRPRPNTAISSAVRSMASSRTGRK